MKTLATLVLAASIAAASTGLAAAQYPPPGAAVVITVSNPNPGVGETITLTIQVSEPGAANVENTSGRMILASMPQEPQTEAQAIHLQSAPYSCTTSVAGGANASVTPSTVQTDADGVATVSLYTGTQAATLTVTVACGNVSGQAIVRVGGGGTGPGAVPRPPSTGLGTSGSSSTGDTYTSWAVIAGLAALGLSGVSVAVLRKSQRSATRS